ncbi:MAG: DUF2069 domain-containing protein [Betaproteobacteria bacterium]|nr:DUF2069 domain-containing protein [Betaproteobacteria bacterium]
MTPRAFNLAASVSLIGLIALCTAWELWLAPLRPGGSWMVLKVVPLLAPLFGILRGRRYTHQWSSMLAMAYLAEGLVRATSDRGPSVALAWLEVALSLVFFAACVGFARLTAAGRGA